MSGAAHQAATVDRHQDPNLLARQARASEPINKAGHVPAHAEDLMTSTDANHYERLRIEGRDGGVMWARDIATFAELKVWADIAYDSLGGPHMRLPPAVEREGMSALERSHYVGGFLDGVLEVWGVTP